MSKRKTLNERRLTKKQVAELVAAGAKPRADLEQAFLDAKIGLSRQPRIYELEGGRILRVFGDKGGLGGKGDIFTIDYFHRFIAWAARVHEDAKAGRQSSVSHWYYYSKLRAEIPTNAQQLLDELAQILECSTLEISYAGLDVASRYVEKVGFDVAQREIYDHLVAYVGEVIRTRTQGRWMVTTAARREPYPYIAAPKHNVIMPVNVAWEALRGLDPADLRHEAANEVRRARANFFELPSRTASTNK
jgi:hypothetical protein